jgi:AcrR family transcriptional regulator
MAEPTSSTTTTRERILGVAHELFTEQGYEATSLRQIADRLGFTKAALYYHFQSKEQLLQALLEPFTGLVDDLMARLEAVRDVEGWADVLCSVIDEMATHMSLFRLLQRNRHVIDQVLEWKGMGENHAQMHERLERAVLDKVASPRDQVRMIAALGAVGGFDDWAPNLMVAIPLPQLQAELSAAVRDILGLPTDAPAAEVTSVTR